MSKRELLDRLAPASNVPTYDGYEEVVIFFDSDAGEWQWTYTLYSKREGYQLRRLGSTGLNNPHIKPGVLHRALIRDKNLGAYIPKTDTWFPPGAGKNVGWCFRQEQHLERGYNIHTNCS